jgi:hypothetical protein
MVPPMVDDIAEALTWILWEMPNPVGCLYPAIKINLYDVALATNLLQHTPLKSPP